jgi:hypothetical protein
MGKIRGEIGGEITGTVGDVTIVTWKGIKIAKRKRGPSTKEPSEALKQQREKFRIATSYAEEVKVDKEKKKRYEQIAVGTLLNWRTMAVKDYLLPPVINRVDVDDYNGKVGDRIDVHIDDVTVEKVHIKILNPEVKLPSDTKTEEALGELVEEGDCIRAIEGQDFHWVYRATKELPGKKFVLLIMAEDLAGNDAMTKVEGEV